MDAFNAAQALPTYPSSPADAPDGKYAIRSTKKGSVRSYGPEIKYSRWFRTPSLDSETIQRLHSIQLLTESHDQGFCENEALGNWTWFELAICENADSTEPRVKDGIQLSWTSHMNELKSTSFTPLEGTIFAADHDIFRLVEKNNVVSVRLCSRFLGWQLVASKGYLVVELGPQVKRGTLNFGSIAAKVASTQEAFNDVNKAMFPDLGQLPSVPDSLFKAEMMSTAIASERPLRVLSLDGGGVRGLASLDLLKKIMDKACPGKKPCEVFDFIGGTSTGGFIAIMLGRLEMTIDQCITNYERFMGQVFPQGGFVKKIPFGIGTFFEVVANKEKWDSSALERAIKQLVEEQLHEDPEKVLLRDEKNKDPSCKVFVTSVAARGSNSQAPVLLRSYSNPFQMPELPDIKLWEAARATSAAPMYFKPLEVNGQTFVDGGLQANNPLGWLWNEILQVYGPVRSTACFLSIGTGIPLSQELPRVTSPIDFTKALTGIATNSDIMNIMFRSLINAFAPRGMEKKYWRFSFGDGLADWVEEDGVGKWRFLSKREEHNLGDLDDVNMIKLTRAQAQEYMKEPGFEKLLNECASALQ